MQLDKVIFWPGMTGGRRWGNADWPTDTRGARSSALRWALHVPEAVGLVAEAFGGELG